MARALILGVNGQDGSFLAEALVRRDFDVVGVGRTPGFRYPMPAKCTYCAADLEDRSKLEALLRELNPDFVFHFAAVHGAAAEGFTYERLWPQMMRVNVFALHALLEHARTVNQGMRVFYAGSCKVFPPPLRGRIDESSLTAGTCLYSIGKIAGRDLIRHYRKTFGVKATNLILFNHDSARRTAPFFLPRIAKTLKQAYRDKKCSTRVQSLDFRIDWSAADELMDIVADLARSDDIDELIMASGKTIYARDFVENLFRGYGLSSAIHIIEEWPRRDPGPEFEVCIDRMIKYSGRRPTKTAFDIVEDILATAE